MQRHVGPENELAHLRAPTHSLGQQGQHRILENIATACSGMLGHAVGGLKGTNSVSGPRWRSSHSRGDTIARWGSAHSWTLPIPSLSGLVHSPYHPCQTLYTPYTIPVRPHTHPIPPLPDPIHSLYHPWQPHIHSLNHPCQTVCTPYATPVRPYTLPIPPLSNPIHSLYHPLSDPIHSLYHPCQTLYTP